MVTLVPAGPFDGDKLVNAGVEVVVTLNVKKLALAPFVPSAILTLCEPVERAGTVQVIDVSPQLLTVAVSVPNLTVPKLVVKFDPVMVTRVPVGPLEGDRLVRVGTEVTVKVRVLLLIIPPLSVTFTKYWPAATLGTLQLMPAWLHPVMMAGVDPNSTFPWVPAEFPKFTPTIETAVSTAPLVGDKLVSVGLKRTVKGKVFSVGTPEPFTTFTLYMAVGSS